MNETGGMLTPIKFIISETLPKNTATFCDRGLLEPIQKLSLFSLILAQQLLSSSSSNTPNKEIAGVYTRRRV